LLENGADPNLRTRIDNFETARELAEEMGATAIVQLLAKAATT
jgi:hypothetical protein